MARSSDRFLLNIFSSYQKVRGTQTSNKPSSLKQISQKAAFQNGFIEHSTKLSSARRLGNISGFNRCLHAHSNIQKPQNISWLLHSGESMAIHVPMFRSHNSSSGFHKVVSVVAAHLRMHNVRLVVYLDDWFLVNQLRNMLIAEKRERSIYL